MYIIPSLLLFTLASCHLLFANNTQATSTESFKTQEELLKQPGACHFDVPKGWEMVDPKVLLPEVKVMVKGKALKANHLPPSINLALEETSLSLEEYLDAIKVMNTPDRNRKWSRMGSIHTKAGDMALTQLDLTSKWGDVRMIQALMIKNCVAYVITATSQLSEFSQFSKEFFSAIRSFGINPTKQLE